MTLDEQLELLAKYPAAVKAATIDAEDRLVDVLGTVHSVQSQLAEWKKNTVSEVSDGERGRMWFTKQGGTYQRSYNTSSLLVKLMPEGGSLAQTLAMLLRLNVISIKWNWMPLKKLIRDRSDIRIIKKEIEDGDPEWDIGEWWKSGYMSYKPVTKDANEPQSG